jgi:hypothetical protein
MTTELSKEIKSSTSAVSLCQKAFDRAREIYLAGLKRLEAEYYERMKQASAQFLGGQEASPSAAPTNSHANETLQAAE